MMRRIHLTLATICVSLFCVGCIPAMQTLRPGAKGKVVDPSGAPIAGANVEIEGPLQYSAAGYHANKRTGHAWATTAKDGQFNIPAERIFGRPVGTPDQGVETARLSIEKQGYNKSSTMFNTDIAADVGTITLQLRK
jgi:hypothetical protein